MKDKFFRDQILDDLMNLAVILESTPSRIYEEEEDKPEYMKEIDGDTLLNDCDAQNCKFWNEGFKSNCVLYSIEINPQHGCMQFQARDKE